MIDFYKALENSVTNFNKPFIYERKNIEYEYITYTDFLPYAKKIATFLNQKYKNKNILLIGKNSINYMLCDIAITMYSGVCININQDTSIEDLNEIIPFFDVSLVIYTNEQKEKINLIKHCDLLNIDEELYSIINHNIEENLIRKSETECVKIIFSSGTTSNPKGIMLSLKNMMQGWYPLQQRTIFTEKDKLYLCLPLHHTYANIFNFYYAFLSGCSLYLCKDIRNMVNDFQEIHPTLFCGVPLIFERFAQSTNDLNALFGNEIRYTYCGGAKLPIDLKTKYLEQGICILDAYALTETSSCFTIEYPFTIAQEGVGEILENLDVQIRNVNKDGVGDIIVKGEAVFLGYYNNPQLTKQSFTDDGYFITNDLGYIKNGRLFVLGRRDRQITNSNGENIYVKDIIDWFHNKNENIIDIHIVENNNKNDFTFLLKENIDNDELKSLVEQFNKKSNKKDKIENFKAKIKNKKLLAI